MVLGYFRFDHNGVSKLGHFNRFEGNQFYSVWLFELVDKVTDRNDPEYVVQLPQLRYVPELVLRTFQTFAVDLNAPKEPIFVVHRSFFEDETIIFRHGMMGLYAIANKMVTDQGLLAEASKEEFPFSDLDATLTEGLLDPILFAAPPSFIDSSFISFDIGWLSTLWRRSQVERRRDLFVSKLSAQLTISTHFYYRSPTLTSRSNVVVWLEEPC